MCLIVLGHVLHCSIVIFYTCAAKMMILKKKKVLTALDYTYIYWNFSCNYSIDHYNFKTTLEKLYPYVEVV